MCLIVMAKAPEAGLAKTRLIPALGEKGAAALAHRLLDHAMQQALDSSIESIRLCVWPTENHPAFAAWAGHARVTVCRQVEGDLGHRMFTALREGLCQAGIQGVMIMGTDAPHLDAQMLNQAANALQNAPAVAVPAADGGYALLGLRQVHTRLFEQMPWSTDRVMALTRERAQALGWQLQELPIVHDIDHPDDLKHLPAEFNRWPR